jgi:hydroxyacylglutathione hydrolase
MPAGIIATLIPKNIQSNVTICSAFLFMIPVFMSSDDRTSLRQSDFSCQAPFVSSSHAFEELRNTYVGRFIGAGSHQCIRDLVFLLEGELMLYSGDSTMKSPDTRAMVIETLAVGSFAANCYIVGSSAAKQGMIIDPGAEAETILKTVRQAGLSISTIVITHAHVDHVGALREVQEKTNAQFAVHQAEKGFLSSAPMRMLTSLGISPVKSPPRPDRILRDGDHIDVGDLSFEVLHTPGHSSGGICLSGHGVVFSGDTLFNLGVGRTDFPGMSHERLMKSIQEKLMALPDETIVYPGHGPPTTIGDERRANPFLQG